MTQKSKHPRHRAMRLHGYDYGQPGAYFVTICVQHRECLLGTITDGKMQLSEMGQFVIEYWERIPQHFPSVELDEYVIMPNHIHGIVAWGITEAISSYLVGARSPRPQENNKNHRSEVPSPSLGRIMAYFKYQSTKRINQHRDRQGTRMWQRDYYDHIIRDDADLQRLRQYIQNNPMKWELDQLHPDNPSKW